MKYFSMCISEGGPHFIQGCQFYRLASTSMKITKICRNCPITCTHREHSLCEKIIHPACRLEYQIIILLLYSPTYCFTSSAQGTLLSTKSCKVLHTKAPTDSWSTGFQKAQSILESKESINSSPENQRENPTRLQTPVSAGLQEIRYLPAWF